MKKLFCSALLIMFVICGCGIKLSKGEQDLAASIMARRIGYTIAEKYPDVAARIAPMAEMILIESDAVVNDLASQIRDIVLSDISDPILRADISDLMGLIVIKGPDVGQYQVKLIRAASKGLLMGVK